MHWDLSAFGLIETERLVLRLPCDDDLKPMTAMGSDPDVMRYLGGPMDREAVWRLIATLLGHWTMRGYGMFSVVERASGDVIGRVGLLEPEGWPAMELSWVLARQAWGRGYAHEAAKSVLATELPRLSARQVISLVDPDNKRSQRLARRLGGFAGDVIDLRSQRLQVFAYDPAVESCDDRAIAGAC